MVSSPSQKANRKAPAPAPEAIDSERLHLAFSLAESLAESDCALREDFFCDGRKLLHGPNWKFVPKCLVLIARPLVFHLPLFFQEGIEQHS